jgi:ferric-dicitrate binding protein FerR (iron transport regulator)
MNKEELINKWLDSGLDDAQLAEFKKLPEYATYAKLSEHAPLFKDDSYDVDLEFQNLKSRLENIESTPTISNSSTFRNILNPLLRVAAVFAVGLTVYYLPIYDNMSTVKTLADQQTTIALPDASTVSLEKSSSLRFQKRNWDEQRKVNLVGEARFKVAKGSSFDVETWIGKVTVIGTDFKVTQRTNFFEIECFEGMVSFDYKGKTVKLPAGKSLRIIDGKIVSKHEIKLA